MATLKLHKLRLTAVAVAGIVVSALPNDWVPAGPCSKPLLPNHVSVAKVVTEAFFDGIIGEAAEACKGKGFYSRGTFLEVVGSYPRFGRVGSVDDSKREIAAFFAHVTHETGRKQPAQGVPTVAVLSNSLGTLTMARPERAFQRAQLPETVATTRPVDFLETASCCWMNFVHPVTDQGFGATIRAMSGDFRVRW
ncbi:hypothetical protein NL676_019244 [Syzygium grande]|nr:hypothetical protein NL676_019244 [Syzygium grande]